MEGHKEVADERGVLDRVCEAGEQDGLAYSSLPSAARAVAESAREVDRFSLVEGEVDGWRSRRIASRLRRESGKVASSSGGWIRAR
ncbi:hypothetical protein [Streptomyces sp. MT206]|uniref:hypothetical protein n=1 Tax=Streptomyces sp. MT206 TaxID=3031407 RepID=UPI002FCAE170